MSLNSKVPHAISIVSSALIPFLESLKMAVKVLGFPFLSFSTVNLLQFIPELSSPPSNVKFPLPLSSTLLAFTPWAFSFEIVHFPEPPIFKPFSQ